MRRNEQRAYLLFDLKLQASILKQKARTRWLKGGNVNSSFFHNVINRRRKRNEIAGIMIDGVWREEVAKVK